MKPKNIILIRHAESEGNANKRIYLKKPDYALELTKKGYNQALLAGENIANFLKREGFSSENKIQFYISPFWRTRQTFQQIVKSFPNHRLYEDPRLREQEWSTNLRIDGEMVNEQKERDNYGHFYYRMPNGEAVSDVFDRISDFLNTLHRDFEKKNYPKNVIIVTHGMTLRTFLMRWFHWSVEEFEALANPRNCEFHILKLNKKDRYDLITTPRKYPSYNHPYQFSWSKLDK